MKGRYKAFLGNTGRYNMVKLPQKLWTEMGWELNDNLKIDIIKSGMHHSISITKEDK